jgi:DNA polymerase-1
MLIDGNSILNRAFYGLMNANMLKTSDGLFTNAVFGFLNIMNMYLEEEKPEFLCVAFDLSAPTFRHAEYDKYKAQRQKMPDELAIQLPLVKQVLDAMNIKRIEIEGYEADDIIGSLAVKGEQAGLEVIVITGDRDALQLAGQNTRIKIPSTRGGRTETREYDLIKIREEYGIDPHQFIDIKGLMGDASDNIPGVRGIGEKTALSLIREFGSIPCIYENIEKISSPSVRKKLEEGRESAFLSKKLAAIDRNIPGLCSIDDLRRRGVDREKLYEVFTRLEFKSFIDKYGLRTQDEQPVASKEVQCIESVKELEELRSWITLNPVTGCSHLFRTLC